jgi:predicted flap endonuclease-1-like 5' DNA nuclease
MENLKCLCTNFPWDILLAWLLPLLLLWWWLSRQINRLKTHNSELQDRINFLEGELDACRKTKISGSVNVETKPLVATEAAIGGAGLAAGVLGLAGAAAIGTASTKKDDLKIVEGIGPKIEELFNKAGIYTFAQLADTTAVRMKEILDAAGPRFQIHNPATWANQAALARDGKWDELKKWQDELYKGKA